MPSTSPVSLVVEICTCPVPFQARWAQTLSQRWNFQDLVSSIFPWRPWCIEDSCRIWEYLPVDVDLASVFNLLTDEPPFLLNFCRILLRVPNLPNSTQHFLQFRKMKLHRHIEKYLFGCVVISVNSVNIPTRQKRQSSPYAGQSLIVLLLYSTIERKWEKLQVYRLQYWRELLFFQLKDVTALKCAEKLVSRQWKTRQWYFFIHQTTWRRSMLSTQSFLNYVIIKMTAIGW